MEHTVDIGGNLAGLLERLAQQIGVTVEQVFPWYVQQAYIEGWVFVICAGIAFLCGMTALVWGAIRFATEGVGHDTPTHAFFLLVVGFFLVFGTFLGCVAGGLSGAVTKIANPNYHAMNMLTRDIGQLAGRR